MAVNYNKGQNTSESSRRHLVECSQFIVIDMELKLDTYTPPSWVRGPQHSKPGGPKSQRSTWVSNERLKVGLHFNPCVNLNLSYRNNKRDVAKSNLLT